MNHLYASSPEKTIFSFVQHPTAKSVVFGFFRHENPTIPDCRLMGVRVNVQIKVQGEKIVLPLIGDFVSWVKKAGVWGYCHHIRKDRKEIHYWVGKNATAENTFEFVMHEIAHGGGFRGERAAQKIAGLGGFAMLAYRDYFEPLLSASSKQCQPSKHEDVYCPPTNALRPCPHCGASLYLGPKWVNGKCCVTCRTCGASGPEVPTEAEAKKAWSAKTCVVPIGTQKLLNHVKLCKKNLKSDRVRCCAFCPFENAVESADIGLAPLFDAKRRKFAVLTSQPGKRP